jgi:hypothetical protein
MTPSLRFNLIIVFALMGTGLGAFVIAPLSHQDRVWLGLAGFLIGLSLGNTLFQERHEKKERQHIHIARNLRDSYYTGLVMKRIMEIYQPQQIQSSEDGEESEEGEEEGDNEAEETSYEDADDQYKWKE